MKRTLGILTLLGIAAAAVWQLGGFEGSVSTEPNSSGTYSVARGDLSITLTERGTLKTLKAEEIKSQVQGKASIQWLMEEGRQVQAGDVVVELDKTDTEKEVEDRRNLIIQLESEENAAKTEELIQREQNQTDLEKADLALEVARAELAKLLEGDIPAKERELELAIDTATSELTRTEARFKEMPTMLEKGFITADQFEDERIKKRKASEALVTAEQAKQLYLKYEKPLQVRQKEAAVTEAERGVIQATNQAQARLEGKKARVNEKQRRLKREQEKLNENLADLEKMTITAPTSGVILYGNPDRSWDTEDIKVGNGVWPNSTLMTIPDPSGMAAVINVHEADIRKIEEGMIATIASETEKGKTYQGRVTKIDKVANAGNRRWGDQIRRFRVEVQIMTDKHELKPGTSASVEMRIGELKDVLHVPIQAVFSREGRFFCYTVGLAGPVETPVKVGRSNDAFLEITEGLEEGKRVLLYKPEATEVGSDAENPEPKTSDRGRRGESDHKRSGSGGKRSGKPQP